MFPTATNEARASGGLRQRLRAAVQTAVEFATLADDPPAAGPPVHPHRVPLVPQRIRRHGAVPPRPSVCLSPVEDVR